MDNFGKGNWKIWCEIKFKIHGRVEVILIKIFPQCSPIVQLMISLQCESPCISQINRSYKLRCKCKEKSFFCNKKSCKFYYKMYAKLLDVAKTYKKHQEVNVHLKLCLIKNSWVEDLVSTKSSMFLSILICL